MESMEKLNKAKIIVTGGAGFIGSHLTERLVAEGVDVVVIDNVFPELSYFTVLKLASKVRVINLDIRHRDAVKNLIMEIKPDYVYHLAAEAIVESSFDDPCTAFDTNIMGTINVLEALRFCKGIKGVIVASSDKAYGKTTSDYTELSPLAGDHPYDASKACADIISRAYYVTYNLPVVVTRFGNVYGEGDFHFNRLIPGICRSVVKNEVLEVRSDGTYERDYLYVKDVVDGYLVLLDKLHKTIGEAYNFSSSDHLNVIEVLKKVENKLGKKIEYNIQNIAHNEIPYQHLDDTKIRALGWKNKFTFDTTIQSIIEWYRAKL